MKKNNRKKWEITIGLLGFTCLIIIISILGISLGMMAGMQIQQGIFIVGIVEVIEGLEKTDIDIEINFNETKFVEELKQVFNESLIDEDRK